MTEMKRVFILILFLPLFFGSGRPFVFAAEAEENTSVDKYTASDLWQKWKSEPLEAPAPAPSPRKKVKFKEEPQEELPTTSSGSLVKVSGRYRLAAGMNGEDFILNDSNANKNLYNLQGPNFEYLFGERLNNTFDQAIYSQHVLNVDFSPVDRINFHTQIVNDPWSWVGTTGEQVQRTDPGSRSVVLRYNLKYFGAFNSTIGEIYRGSDADRYNFPIIKVHDGHVTQQVVNGLTQLSPPSGVSVTIPELDIDYEYRPIRKLWMDINPGEDVHGRIFAFADQSEALTTDDPLELSNHHDYWQQSPWLYQYKPIQFFVDVEDIHSIKRGFYSDNLSYQARDSEGNWLVLLRGASVEGKVEKTSFAATVAAPYTPWDYNYFDADNIPAALRVKQQLTDEWMLGGTYTLRTGLIDNEIADRSQVWAMDTRYQINGGTAVKGEAAVSHREQDLKASKDLEKATDGYAYKAIFESKFDHPAGDDTGHADIHLSYTQMGQNFKPPLSLYFNTRDDDFWGTHIPLDKVSDDLEPFRIGDGVDTNRFVFRANWKEKLFRDKFFNLFDARNVHKTKNAAYIETVIRDEAAYKINSQWTVKGLFRWRGLPRSTPNVDSAFTGFYFPKDDIDLTDFSVRNTAVEADKNADQYTYSLGLEYLINPRWTAEGIVEYANNIPDFPRGLLNEFSKDVNDRVDGIITDRIVNFLYDQSALKAAPPYPYYTVTKERVIYTPQKNLAFTLHATQNTYRFAGGIDDNINHVGLSAAFQYNAKLSFFADCTFSQQIDIPKLIATNLAESDYDGHQNFYASMDYKLNSSTVFRAEYGVFGLGTSSADASPYSVSSFTLPAIDTEHLFRMSLTGDF